MTVMAHLTTSRRLRAVACLLISLIAVAASSAVANAQPTSSQQSAVSSGFFAPFFFGSFNAVSDAGGANASGSVYYHTGGGFGPTVTASVVCLSVSGNAAVIGFEGIFNSPFFPPPRRVVGELVVVDNGTSPPSFDTIGLSERVTETGTANCSSPGPLAVGPVQVTGDIIVQAAALPTSKEQCKTGGVAQFGFKNQGQCVAFVERGPKG
jgi:hypothetical protein